MASEKESLDSSKLQNKPAMFAAPSLTSKSSSAVDLQQQEGANKHSSAGNLPGYYQNVTQKGKLILPTAIWILIVVGGLCFLSLLSSLSKTIGTLDTLVELEQEKARHRQESPFSPMAGVFEQPPKRSNIARATGDKDWLSMPSWASLERQQPTSKRANREESEHYDLSNLIEDVLEQTGASGEGIVPINARIIVASTLSEDGSDEEGKKSPSRLLDSIFGKLLNVGERESSSKVERDEEEKSTSGSMITANIGKVNININQAPQAADEKEATAKRQPLLSNEFLADGPSAEVGRPDEDQSVIAIDRAIDALMSKLVASNNPDTAPVEPKSRPHARPHKQPRPTATPFLSPFISMADFLQHGPQPHSLVDDSIPPIFGRPQSSSHFVIAFGSGDPSSSGEPSSLFMDGGRPVQYSLERPRPPTSAAPHSGSPYELAVSNDLFELPTLKPMQSNNKPVGDDLIKLENNGDDKRKAEDLMEKSSSVLIINGGDEEPLISEKKQSLASDEDSSLLFGSKTLQLPSRNKVSDLFSLFFGPPPGSELVVAPQSTPTTVEPVSMAPQPAATNQSKQDNSEVELAQISNELKDSSEQLLDGLLGKMFTLAQTGAERAPELVNDDSKDTTTTTKTTTSPASSIVGESANNETSIGSDTIKILQKTTQEIFDDFSRSTSAPFGGQEKTTPEQITTSTSSSSSNNSPIFIQAPDLFGTVSVKPTTTEAPASQSTNATRSTTAHLEAAGETTTPGQQEKTTTTHIPKTTKVIAATPKPIKSFFQRADDFLEKNFLNFRSLF